MNCEVCQELIHDLIDGSISRSDESLLNRHLKECLDCEGVREDLTAIVGFSRAQRGQYEEPPNAQALWLRIRNVIEAENPAVALTPAQPRRSWLARLMRHQWELSLPQLATSTVAIVLLVSLATVVGLRRWGGYGAPTPPAEVAASNVNDLIFQRQQVIDYWNQRILLKKARWSPETREAFERTLKALDQDVANSLRELNQNPHDEAWEQMLNQSLNDKIRFLEDFSDL